MRHAIFLVFAASIAFLAACGTSDAPQSKEEVAAEVAKAEKLKPGQYQMTMTVSKVDVPGMPPEAQAQMKQMMAKPNVMDYCLTPEQADQGMKEMLTKMNGNCTYSNFDVSGASVTGAMACTGPGGVGTLKASFQGMQTATASKLDMKTEITGGPANLTMKMESRVDMKRIGDCKS